MSKGSFEYRGKRYTPTASNNPDHLITVASLDDGEDDDYKQLVQELFDANVPFMIGKKSSQISMSFEIQMYGDVEDIAQAIPLSFPDTPRIPEESLEFGEVVEQDIIEEFGWINDVYNHDLRIIAEAQRKVFPTEIVALQTKELINADYIWWDDHEQLHEEDIEGLDLAAAKIAAEIDQQIFEAMLTYEPPEGKLIASEDTYMHPSLAAIEAVLKGIRVDRTTMDVTQPPHTQSDIPSMLSREFSLMKDLEEKWKLVLFPEVPVKIEDKELYPMLLPPADEARSDAIQQHANLVKSILSIGYTLPPMVVDPSSVELLPTDDITDEIKLLELILQDGVNKQIDSAAEAPPPEISPIFSPKIRRGFSLQGNTAPDDISPVAPVGSGKKKIDLSRG